MIQVYNCRCEVVHTFRNLCGLHRLISKDSVKAIGIDTLPNNACKLYISFTNTNSCEVNFDSLNEVINTIKRWRNLYNAPLYLNGTLIELWPWSENLWNQIKLNLN